MKWNRVVLVLAAPLAIIATIPAMGEIKMQRPMAAVVGRSSNLPAPLPHTDPMGNQWMIYPGGRLQQQGNMPVFSEVATIVLNNQMAGFPNNQVRMEDGDFVLESPGVGGVSLLRRIGQLDDGTLRIIDTFSNSSKQPVTARVQYRTNINYGVQNGQTLVDPRKKDQVLGCVAQDGQNRSILELYAGPGSKLTPTVVVQPNNNMLQSIFTLTIPAGKSSALMHLHVAGMGGDNAESLLKLAREGKLTKPLTPALRGLLANFRASMSLFSDLELLRGETSDVIELKSGDQIKGTLRDASYKMKTDFGEMDISADRLLAMMNVQSVRPRQLLALKDGQIIGGQLQQPAIQMQLSSGQTTQVPLAQINRVGTWKKTEEETVPPEQPMVFLRGGERIAVQLPAQPLQVVTRLGPLSLPADQVAGIIFPNEEQPNCTILLRDASRLMGLPAAGQLELKLIGEASQSRTIPTASVERLILSKLPDEPAPAAGTLSLMGEDLLVGAFTDQWRLITAYDMLDIAANQVKRLSKLAGGQGDVQVVLWDESSFSGRMDSPLLSFACAGGLSLHIPSALIENYQNPWPQPSAAVKKRVVELVAQLNAEDWKQRDRAEAQLVSLGDAIRGILLQLKPAQTPEAQQRIDNIVKALSGESKAPEPAVNPAPAAED